MVAGEGAEEEAGAGVVADDHVDEAGGGGVEGGLVHFVVGGCVVDGGVAPIEGSAEGGEGHFDVHVAVAADHGEAVGEGFGGKLLMQSWAKRPLGSQASPVHSKLMRRMDCQTGARPRRR